MQRNKKQIPGRDSGREQQCKIALHYICLLYTSQRYKGLGEMDAEQLWETTLNPATRILKRIEIEDARMASSVTEMLMGTEVPPRRAFIYEHARDAELDI